MVKALMVAVLAVLMVSLVGCGGGGQPPVVVVQQPAAPATPVTTGPIATGPVTGSVTGALPGTPDDSAPIVNGTIGQGLDTIVRAAAAREGNFSGTVMVCRGNEILLSQGYGVMTTSTNAPMPANAIWDWCSVSKQFTAAAILKLQMMGRLKLDDPMGKYLPCPADKTNITIRQLLSHTSGMQQYDRANLGDGSRDVVLQALLNLPMAETPGQRFDYNNGNYSLAASIVERNTGMAFEDFVRGYLWRPAGMYQATFLGDTTVNTALIPFDQNGQQFPQGPTMPGWWRGAGGATMPMRQLLYWDMALRGNSILDDASKTELYRVIKSDYALGWTVTQKYNDTVYEHDGSSSTETFNYLRGKDSGIVVAVATSHDTNMVYTLADNLFSYANGIMPPSTALADVAPASTPVRFADIDRESLRRVRSR